MLKEELKKDFKAFKKRVFKLDTLKVLTDSVYLSLNMILLYINIQNWIKMIIIAFLFVIYSVVKGIFNEIEKEKSKIPTMSKRFTEKHENGAVTIDENRFREAILYLYEVEDKLYGKK